MTGVLPSHYQSVVLAWLIPAFSLEIYNKYIDSAIGESNL